jgi:hypothetical protein
MWASPSQAAKDIEVEIERLLGHLGGNEHGTAPLFARLLAEAAENLPLARKVLIFDEVHAHDAYLRQLVCGLLRFHAAGMRARTCPDHAVPGPGTASAVEPRGPTATPSPADRTAARRRQQG